MVEHVMYTDVFGTFPFDIVFCEVLNLYWLLRFVLIAFLFDLFNRDGKAALFICSLYTLLVVRISITLAFGGISFFFDLDALALVKVKFFFWASCPADIKLVLIDGMVLACRNSGIGLSNILRLPECVLYVLAPVAVFKADTCLFLIAIWCDGVVYVSLPSLSNSDVVRAG